MDVPKDEAHEAPEEVDEPEEEIIPVPLPVPSDHDSDFTFRTVEDLFNYTVLLKYLARTCCSSDIVNAGLAENEHYVEYEKQDKTKNVYLPCCKKKEKKKEGPNSKPKRPLGNWNSELEFFLASAAYCVGLGNIWRFPTLAYDNGGGAFIIPYTLIICICGIPLFIMEVSIGQFAGKGPTKIWCLAPLFRGIGIAMTVVAYLVAVYFNVVAAWAFFYIIHAFQSPLPWTRTRSWWNKNTYWDTFTGDKRFLTGFYGKSPSQEFFDHRLLQSDQSIGLLDPVEIIPELALLLSLAWFIVFLCISNGIKSGGKTAPLTIFFPYLFLFVLFVKCVTLDGADTGIWYYFTPNWERLYEARIWGHAASQIFFSLNICRGGTLKFGSRNAFSNTPVRQTIILIICNTITSLYAGVVVFCILGHVAFRQGKEVNEVAAGGPGLAFVAYPEGMTLLPYPAVWSAAFFLMMLMLALESEMNLCNGVCAAITEVYPKLFKSRQLLLASIFCGSAYSIGLLLVTKGGIFWFSLIDGNSSSLGFFIMATTWLMVVNWGYGHYFTYKWRFNKDFELMTGQKPHILLRLTWRYIIPAVMPVLFMMKLLSFKISKSEYYWERVAHNTFSIMVTFMPVFFMVLFGFIQIYKYYDAQKGIMWSIRAATIPTFEWGPQDPTIEYTRTPKPPPVDPV